jgi:integrase
MKPKEHKNPIQRKTNQSLGRKITIIPTPEIQDVLNEFLATLEHDLSERTKQEYQRIAIQVLHARTPAHRIHIRSKSKWLQVRAVVKRMIHEQILPDDVIIYGLKRQWKGNAAKNTAAEIANTKVFSPDQFQQLLALLPTDARGQELRLACEYAFYLGLRLNEILTLTASDFERRMSTKGMILVLNVKHGKGEKSRLIPIPKAQTDLIERFRPLSIKRSFVEYEFKKAVRKLTDDPTTKLSFHGLRHSFATHYQGELDTLQQLLGHADITTRIKYYRHTSVLDDEKTLEYFGYSRGAKPKDRQ